MADLLVEMAPAEEPMTEAIIPTRTGMGMGMETEMSTHMIPVNVPPLASTPLTSFVAVALVMPRLLRLAPVATAI